MEYVSGEVAFSHLTEFEKFQGESTGKYSVTITLDDEAASKLEGQGVKLKTHEGKKQRAFKTKYELVEPDKKGFIVEHSSNIYILDKKLQVKKIIPNGIPSEEITMLVKRYL